MCKTQKEKQRNYVTREELRFAFNQTAIAVAHVIFYTETKGFYIVVNNRNTTR